MDRSPVLFLILLGLLFSVFLVAYTSVVSTVSVSERLFTSSATENPLKNGIDTSYYRIQDIRFYERALIEYNGTLGPCELNRTKEKVIIELLFDNTRHPENCEVMIDNSLAAAFTVESFRDAEEFIHTESLVFVDTGAEHELLVCCDSVCTEEKIDPMCSEKP